MCGSNLNVGAVNRPVLRDSILNVPAADHRQVLCGLILNIGAVGSNGILD